MSDWLTGGVVTVEETCICGKQCQESCVKSIPIFSDLDAAQCAEIARLVTTRSYPKNGVIYEEGSSPGYLIIVRSGRIKVFRYTDDGKEQIAYILSRGDFFGVPDVLRETTARFSLQATDGSQVCTIAREDLEQLLIGYPDIAIKVIKELCVRLDRMERLVQSATLQEADVRIHTMLLDFADKFGRPHPDGTLIELPLTREDMAGYVGLTRETISRKLTALELSGVLRQQGHKKILLLRQSVLKQSLAGCE